MNITGKIENSIDGLISKLSSLSQRELNTIPAENRWTAAQIGDHLLKSYNMGEMLKAPVEPTSRPADLQVEKIKEVFLNFELKMKSPKEICPTEEMIDKQELITALETKKTELMGLAEGLDLTQTCTAFAIPGYDEFTRLEWLSFIMIHTQRHMHQLEGVAEEVTQEV